MLLNSGIYKIENKVNGKFYIGRSFDLEGRWKAHLIKLKNQKHHSIYLQNAFNKYGKESFVFIILHRIPNEYCIKMEQWYLDNHKGQYNISSSAQGGDYYKFSREEQISILERYSRGDISLQKLANIHGVNHKTITSIISGNYIKDFNIPDDLLKRCQYLKDHRTQRTVPVEKLITTLTEYANSEISLTKVALKHSLERGRLSRIIKRELNIDGIPKNLLDECQEKLEKRGMRGLHMDIVKSIIYDYCNEFLSMEVIGRKYDLSFTHIQKILSEKYLENRGVPLDDITKVSIQKDNIKYKRFLTDDVVKKIQWLEGKMTITDISRLFNTTLYTVKKIHNKEMYAHIKNNDDYPHLLNKIFSNK